MLMSTPTGIPVKSQHKDSSRVLCVQDMQSPHHAKNCFLSLTGFHIVKLLAVFRPYNTPTLKGAPM